MNKINNVFHLQGAMKTMKTVRQEGGAGDARMAPYFKPEGQGWFCTEGEGERC
jgi:hypothetical protein